MIINPQEQSTLDNYKLLIGSVIPRPIAFVTSQSEAGLVNAAPFSFFNVVATKPPLLAFSCIRKAQGRLKDTAANILNTKEFVIHVVDEDNVQQINDTATDFPAEISEVEQAGLTLVESNLIQVPGVKEAKIRMECKLYQHIPLGGNEETPNADLIIGEVLMFHLQDDLLVQGRLDPHQLAPISRLTGTTYGKLGELFSMPRLSYDEFRQVKNKPTLEELCVQITEENRHQEIDFGKPKGKEV